LWTSFRADTSGACPPVDAGTFTGPDTNSTALAMLGLKAQGHTTSAADGATGLDAVRNGAGAWGFLAAADQPTDANSTGVVMAALRAVTGSRDSQGAAALSALQVGCDATEQADVGGIAFQAASGGDSLVPDVLATIQAIPALAGVVLPQTSPTITDDLTDLAALCAPAPTSSSTTATTSTSIIPLPPVQGVGTSAAIAAGGSSSVAETGVALILIGTGSLLVLQADARRRRLV